MQLILVQHEVEQAIKDYVGKLINIASDTQIDIDLSATRGSEGVKAIIELTPAGNPPANKAAAPVETAAVVRSPRPKRVSTMTQTIGTDPEPTKAEETVVEGAETDSTAAEETTDDAEATEEVTEAQEPPPVPATPAKSLFANLRKPQN